MWSRSTKWKAKYQIKMYDVIFYLRLFSNHEKLRKTELLAIRARGIRHQLTFVFQIKTKISICVLMTFMKRKTHIETIDSSKLFLLTLLQSIGFSCSYKSQFQKDN